MSTFLSGNLSFCCLSFVSYSAVFFLCCRWPSLVCHFMLLYRKWNHQHFYFLIFLIFSLFLSLSLCISLCLSRCAFVCMYLSIIFHLLIAWKSHCLFSLSFLPCPFVIQFFHPFVVAWFFSSFSDLFGNLFPLFTYLNFSSDGRGHFFLNCLELFVETNRGY